MIERNTLRNVSILLGTLLLVACGQQKQDNQPSSGPRNVILFVGDGLGATQTAVGVQYARLIDNRELNIDLLMQAGNTGYAMPLPHEHIVTDSAAAATHFATGQRVRNESLGIDPDGWPLETILERAHAQGLGTGIVTNMRVTHATPASFAVHTGWRYDGEPKIMDDLLREGDVDVLLGGGARAIVPAGTRASETFPGIPDELDGDSQRDDELYGAVDLEARGYTVVSDVTALRDAAGRATKLLGMFASSNLPYVLDRWQMNLTTVPKLADLTSAAIEVLSRREEGFFLVVEGGRIDYAGHASDPGSLLHEVLDFDEAVGVGLEFQRNNPETLVIVTGDHGTGGFSFSTPDLWHVEETTLPSGITHQKSVQYPGREHLQLLHRQSASYPYILEHAGLDPEKLVELVQEHTGLEMTIEEARTALIRDEDGLARPIDFRDYYSDPEDSATALLARALSRQTYVVWSTGEHTMDLVPTYGTGPGAEKLRGIYPNTRIYEVMREALDTRPGQ